MTTKPLISVHDLSPGEALVIARRRDGTSQSRAARDLGVGRMTYSRMENDLHATPFCVLLGKLAEHEIFYLLRRRAGLSRAQLASTLGVSLSWLTDMERGRVSNRRLSYFWEHREGRRKRSA